MHICILDAKNFFQCDINVTRPIVVNHMISGDVERKEVPHYSIFCFSRSSDLKYTKQYISVIIHHFPHLYVVYCNATTFSSNAHTH